MSQKTTFWPTRCDVISFFQYYSKEYDPEAAVKLIEDLNTKLIKVDPNYGETLRLVILFLLKCIKDSIKDDHKTKLLGSFKSILENFFKKKTTKISGKFLTDLAQRFPFVLGKETLFEGIKNGVNGFR